MGLWEYTVTFIDAFLSRISWVIKFQGKTCRFQILSAGVGLIHKKETSSFMTSWHILLSDWKFSVQEIFSLDKFWFRESTQNTFKPLVWHLLHQNILIINAFMKVYEKLIIFKKITHIQHILMKKVSKLGV